MADSDTNNISRVASTESLDAVDQGAMTPSSEPDRPAFRTQRPDQCPSPSRQFDGAQPDAGEPWTIQLPSANSEHAAPSEAVPQAVQRPAEEKQNSETQVVGEPRQCLPPQEVTPRAPLSPLDFWPGLTRLFLGKQGGGLLQCLLFHGLINAWAVVEWLWVGLGPRLGGWGLLWVTVAWGVSVFDARKYRNWHYQRATGTTEGLFSEARAKYLRGEWAAAERLFGQMIAQYPEDIAAQLTLSAMLRHQGRFDETREQLRRVQRWQAASGWAMELRREWELLAKAEFAAGELQQTGTAIRTATMNAELEHGDIASESTTTSGSALAEIRRQRRAARSIRNVSVFGRAA